MNRLATPRVSQRAATVSRHPRHAFRARRDGSGNPHPLWARREAAGVSFPDLAAMTGFSIMYLLQIESGQVEIGSETQRLISDAIDQLDAG